MTSRKEHWDQVYATKPDSELSWTQSRPTTSLNFIHSFRLPRFARIIDVGGGDSRLVDYLLDEGYTDLAVLDISEIALERAKERLGARAKRVQWIIDDVTEFRPRDKYDCWHDRATFHFLTSIEEINLYLSIAREAVKSYMVVGTFSSEGPKKCSMIDVHRYSEEELSGQLSNGFEKIKCIAEDHRTPFDTTQNFLFCSFRKKNV